MPVNTAHILPLYAAEPSTPYRANRMDQSAEDPILKAYRDEGNWLAVSTNHASKIVADYQEMGKPLPDYIALMDLHYWLDKGSKIKPRSYYAKRWGWGDKRVRLFLEKQNVKRAELRAKQGPTEGQSRAKETAIPEQKETVGASEGPAKGQTGAKYIHTHTHTQTKKGGKRPPNRPESLQQVQACFRERSYFDAESEAESFWNYFQSNGWVIGKGRAPCKDWKAAASNWNKNAKKFAAERKPSNGALRDRAKEQFKRDPD